MMPHHANYIFTPAKPTLTSIQASQTVNFTGTWSNINLTLTTLDTSPPGRSMIVDGTTMTMPQTFSWLVGSTHTVSVLSPQAGASGVQYKYAVWSDLGAQSHTITTPATASTIRPYFATQFLLTTVVNPLGAGSLVMYPSSADGYYAGGTDVQINPIVSLGKPFSSYSGDLSGPAYPQSVSMTAPRSVTANFYNPSGGNLPPYGQDIYPFQGAGVTQTFTERSTTQMVGPTSTQPLLLP